MAPLTTFLPYLPLLALFTPTASCAGLVYPDCVSGPLKGNLVCNTSMSAVDRATALVAAMSNSDKLNNLVNNSPGFSKLGIAAYQWWNEALHGVAHNRGITWGGAFSAATQFPQAITTGAAFDDDLVEKIGAAIGTEARAFANNGRAHLDFWTPNVNPFRDPRWGRGHETPGEDAFRNGRYAAAFVRGMEGNGTTKRVIATCKHFAAYDLENSGSTTRFNFDAKVTMQDLAEYYLPPFEKCARDAHVGSIMCSYNAVNGIPACANAYLMDTILRGHWNWTGDNQYIVSDCDAVYYLGNANGGHRYKSSQTAAAGAAFEAGTDNICWATNGAAPDPSAAFSQKQFSQATLDKMMVRQYQGLIRAGMFDGPQGAYRNLGASDVNTANAKVLALQAAQEGIVLLKNDGVLPLTAPSGSGDASSTSLAMIGFWASKADEMLGGYSGTPPFNHDPVTAAKQLGFSVTAASGPIAQSSGDTSAATTAAKNAHTILYFGGIDNSVEKESNDRTNIAWPAGQLAQIKALAALNKPVIIIKMGTHVDDSPLLAMPNVRAILWAGYPGQDGGTAVMNVLLGRPAPAGRLPITMYPSSYTQDAPMTNMALRPSSNYPGRTYRWYDKAVFSFGHGLHYTNFSAVVGGASFPSTFSIASLLSSCAETTYLDRCPFPSLPVTVTNAGSDHTSDYVGLAFLTGSYGPAPFPRKTLAAYTRLFNLTAGQTQTSDLTWTLGNLARVDANGNRVLYPGNYTVLLDEPAIANLTFSLTGSEAVLDKWPQPK
ncbi:hypothetical protein Sste5346_001396 [Sporothrix stenoceras]|uniref:xylan 1,4-beta-xylosidase n=1 Tax=Sporothrix stenoceras TaxID=5173 RepID=A0ABR3ZP31_9PEZI